MADYQSTHTGSEIDNAVDKALDTESGIDALNTALGNLADVATSGAYSDLSGRPTIPSASSTTPLMDGTAAVGNSTRYARANHVHPSDTSKQDSLAGQTIVTINGTPIQLGGSATISGGGDYEAASASNDGLMTSAMYLKMMLAANGVATCFKNFELLGFSLLPNGKFNVSINVGDAQFQQFTEVLEVKQDGEDIASEILGDNDYSYNSLSGILIIKFSKGYNYIINEK